MHRSSLPAGERSGDERSEAGWYFRVRVLDSRLSLERSGTGYECLVRVLLAHTLNPKRRRLARVLAGAGHDVVEVDTPEEGLACCRTWAPAVALIHAECCGDLVC